MRIEFENEDEAALMLRLIEAGAKNLQLECERAWFENHVWVASCRAGFLRRKSFTSTCCTKQRRSARLGALEALLVALGVRHCDV